MDRRKSLPFSRRSAHRDELLEAKLMALLGDSEDIADAVLDVLDSPTRVCNVSVPEINTRALEQPLFHTDSSMTTTQKRSLPMADLPPHIKDLAAETVHVLDLLEQSGLSGPQHQQQQQQQQQLVIQPQQAFAPQQPINADAQRMQRPFTSVSSTRRTLCSDQRARYLATQDQGAVVTSADLPPAPQRIIRPSIRERATRNHPNHVPNIMRQDFTLSSSGLSASFRPKGKYLQGYRTKGIPPTLRDFVESHPEVADFDDNVPDHLRRSRVSMQ